MTRSLGLMMAVAMSLPAAVSIEKVAWGGWPNCYKMTNGEVELIITSDVGPRIIRYGFVGGDNIFKEFTAELGKSGEKAWTPRGGHRIWVAPEVMPMTYALDNGPVKITVKGNTLTALQPVEPETGLQKSITVTLSETGSGVEVLHTIVNKGTKTMDLAPWALTMMAPGGFGVTGYPPRGTHPEVLAPTNPLIMWAFTDLSDPRWIYTKKYLVLRNDPNNKVPQKLGVFNEKTWGAYHKDDLLFIKRYAADPKAKYPDFGASYETFTNAEFLELETLGPLRKLTPAATMTHTERWTLHKGISITTIDDATLDKVLLPLL